MPVLVRLEPEQSYNESLLPLQVGAASAGPGLHPPVADWRVSGRLPDAVPALEVFRERAVHEARRGVPGIFVDSSLDSLTARRHAIAAASSRCLIRAGSAARVPIATASRRLAPGVWKLARSYARATSSRPAMPRSVTICVEINQSR